MAIKSDDELQVVETVDPEAMCAFINPVDRSLSESFYCRTNIRVLSGLWWLGSAEIAISQEGLQKFMDEYRMKKTYANLIRFQTRGLSGTAHIIKTQVQDQSIVTVLFVGLTGAEFAE